MTALAPLDRIDDFLASVCRLVPAVPGEVLAVGWATVEVERTASELAAALGIPADRFATADEDELLGARCLVAREALPGGRTLVALEPSTEGRLAATLARQGEGPVAIWWAANPAARVATGGAVPNERDTVAAAGDAAVVGHEKATNMSAARSGPFGPERLVLGGPIHGPHRLVTGSPGTIRA